MDTKKNIAKELARKSVENNTPLEWFEELYNLAQNDTSIIPWFDAVPNPNLVEIMENNTFLNREKGSCLVVGCGMGDDAEYLSEMGFSVDAFDISETAIHMCKNRFPNSKVSYFIDNLVDPGLTKTYDLVFESYTLQVLTEDIRNLALRNLKLFLKKNGKLLLICRIRNNDTPLADMPWPLRQNELSWLSENLTLMQTEDYYDTSLGNNIRRCRNIYLYR